MMLVILPSNSLHNKQWCDKAAQTFNELFDSCYVPEYGHWKKGHGIIDINWEVDNLARTVKGKEYIIFAKSAGVLVALKGISENKINPAKCLFVSTPILWAQENKIPVEKWLEGYSRRTVFLQKKSDPVIAADELKELLETWGCRNYSFVNAKGEGRDYDDFGQMKEIMIKLLNKN